MPVRSTTSEYQPSPPWLRLKTTKVGTGVNRVVRATATNNVKSNSCCVAVNSDAGTTGAMQINVSFSG